MRLPALALLGTFALLDARALPSQARPAVSFDVTAGYGTAFGATDRYRSSSGVAGAMTLARRLAPHASTTRVLALSAGGRATINGTDMCLIVQNDECAPDAPSLLHLGVLGGAEHVAAAIPIRVLAGPALYFGGGSAGAGAQLQVDVATPALVHVAAVLSGRVSQVARFNGERLRLGAFGVGLRFQ